MSCDRPVARREVQIAAAAMRRAARRIGGRTARELRELAEAASEIVERLAEPTAAEAEAAGQAPLFEPAPLGQQILFPGQRNVAAAVGATTRAVPADVPVSCWPAAGHLRESP